MKIRYKNKTMYKTMEVVQDQGPLFLGSNDCERLGLVKRIDTVGHTSRRLKDEIQLKYPELFNCSHNY